MAVLYTTLRDPLHMYGGFQEVLVTYVILVVLPIPSVQAENAQPYVQMGTCNHTNAIIEYFLKRALEYCTYM